jgi:hypothetical protein
VYNFEAANYLATGEIPFKAQAPVSHCLVLNGARTLNNHKSVIGLAVLKKVKRSGDTEYLPIIEDDFQK